jgi:hypothetical protein
MKKTETKISIDYSMILTILYPKITTRASGVLIKNDINSKKNS